MVTGELRGSISSAFRWANNDNCIMQYTPCSGRSIFLLFFKKKKVFNSPRQVLHGGSLHKQPLSTEEQEQRRA